MSSLIILEELTAISDLIDSLIKNDDYPGKIEPLHLKNAVISYPMRTGKRVRPALLIWSCGLLEGDIRRAEYAAAAVEVYHNWTLVHDDIIDEDELRRGMPATHIELEMFARDKYPKSTAKAKKFGIDFAILAGDLQHAWAMDLLLKSTKRGVSSNITAALCTDLCEMLSRELISGEALDVEFSYRNLEDITSVEVERMMYLKTGALLNYSVVTGAKIALNIDNEIDERLQKLVDFATALGMAFQLRDDWLGIFGETASFGKPLGSDICAAKPTILILDALKKLDINDKNKLLSFIGTPKISYDQLMEVKHLIRKSGAEKNIMKKAEQLKNYAKKALIGFPDNKYKKLLLDLNDYLIGRNS
jgi:geranylgeranyl diphosphate synthase, type I